MTWGIGRPAKNYGSPNRLRVRCGKAFANRALETRFATHFPNRHTQGYWSMRQLVAISMGVVVAWAGACAAQGADPGPVRVGDRWSYEVKDDVTGDLRHAVTVVVADINDKEITTRVSHRGKDHPQTIIFNLDWGRIDDTVRKFQPGEPGIKRPLQIGKQWRSDYNMTNLKTGFAFRASAAAKVVGQESVTTPAGTFDTLRIETTVREVNTRDQTKSSVATYVTWYAPAINRWVRRKYKLQFEGRVRDSVSEELVDYARQP
jgi:hypothetical protein